VGLRCGFLRGVGGEGETFGVPPIGLRTLLHILFWGESFCKFMQIVYVPATASKSHKLLLPRHVRPGQIFTSTNPTKHLFVQLSSPRWESFDAFDQKFLHHYCPDCSLSVFITCAFNICFALKRRNQYYVIKPQLRLQKDDLNV